MCCEHQTQRRSICPIRPSRRKFWRWAEAIARLTSAEDEVGGSPLAEDERIEMAGYINSRNTIIAALAAFLGLSVLTNILVLLTR